MAGVKVSDYQLGDSGAQKWTNFLTTIEKQRKGFIALSLTNYDNNNAPQIAAGSVVEISGALYQFESDEAINGTPTSGVVNYIYIDPADILPYWTTTAPTWSSAKGGWYDSTETKRYIGGCYYDGTNYQMKWILSDIHSHGEMRLQIPIENVAIYETGIDNSWKTRVGYLKQGIITPLNNYAVTAKIAVPLESYTLIQELTIGANLNSASTLGVYLYRYENNSLNGDGEELLNYTINGTGGDITDTKTNIQHPVIEDNYRYIIMLQRTTTTNCEDIIYNIYAKIFWVKH